MPFKPNQTVYFDTSLFIFYFENHPKKAQVIEQYFLATAKPGIKLIASELLLTELLVAPLKTKNQKLVDLYNSLELHIPNLTLIPISREILITAATLKVKHRLKTPDAIHLATAQAQKAHYFLTADKLLAKLTFPKIILI